LERYKNFGLIDKTTPVKYTITTLIDETIPVKYKITTLINKTTPMKYKITTKNFGIKCVNLTAKTLMS
jgi:hypothetical protein